MSLCSLLLTQLPLLYCIHQTDFQTDFKLNWRSTMLRGSNTLLRQCVLQSSSSSSSASASANASALCIRRNQRTQMRTYVFLPSSYKELQHDLALWLTNRREKRTILVKLMKDSYQETKTRIRRRTRTMKLRPPSQNAMSIKYRPSHLCRDGIKRLIIIIVDF